MTVSSTTRKAGPFPGNAGTTVFPFGFKVFDKTDVKALLVNATGASTTLVLDSDYSVALAADQDTSPGGSITYPISGDPLPAGYSIVLLGDLPYDQETTISNSGGFYPSVLEDMSDRSTIQIQQLAEITSRAIVVPESESTSPTLPNAAARANSVLGFDASGNVEAIPLPASIGAGNLKNESWTAGTDYVAGTSMSVALSQAYGTKANLGTVVMAGIPQDPATYSLSGLVLTFLDGNGAPTVIPVGINRIWCYGGTTLSTNVTPDGSVTDIKVAPGANIDSGKIMFTPPWVGGVPRLLSARQADRPNIRDFGQCGGGVNDDTAVIIKAHATGMLIDYPSDTFAFDHIPSIPAGGIRGDGVGKTIFQSFNTASDDLITFTGEVFPQETPIFRDFLLKVPTNSSKAGGCGLVFTPTVPSSEVQYVDLQNVFVWNVPTGVKSTASTKFSYRALRVYDYLDAGVVVDNTYVADSGDSTIVDCFLSTTLNAGLGYGIWQRASGGLKILGGKMLGGNTGYALGFDGNLTTGDLLITGTSIEKMRDYGVYLGRDGTTNTFGAITLTGLQINLVGEGITVDASGAISQLAIGNCNIAVNGNGLGGEAGIRLNNCSDFVIGPNMLISNGGDAGSAGIVCAAACSNGLIHRQGFKNISSGNKIVNASGTVTVL